MAARNVESDISETRGVERLARLLIMLIRWIAGGLAGYFTFVQLKGAPVERITDVLTNHGVMKIALLIFFVGWLFGATHDTEIQQAGYCRDPKEGGLGRKEVAAIVASVIVFAALLALHKLLVWFQLALVAFILVNTWTWHIIVKRTIPIIDASYRSFTSPGEKRDNFAAAKLILVVQYMNGHWQRLRFMTLIALALIQLIFAILLKSGLLQPIAGYFAFRQVPGDVVLSYAPSVLFLIYVLISEVWMKIFRIKIFSDLNTIEYLAIYFTIAKRKDGALPRPFLAPFGEMSEGLNRNYVGMGPVSWADWFMQN